VSGYKISPNARRELRSLIQYIARESPAGARKTRDAIFDGFRELAGRPGLGHTRPDLTALPVRFWTVTGRYTIVYRELSGAIEIVRVISAGRDVKAILGR
jgi:plasmid stabilization system protein ParE